MCGIFGSFNGGVVHASLLAHRGRDACGVASRDGAVILGTSMLPQERGIGHFLHAVVGEVPQPLKGKGTLSANCEIYNWKALANAAKITASNDAELLLRLLDIHPIEKVLEMIDGDYAFAYLRNGYLWLCRDLIGVKPLWYSTKKGLAFASERQALSQPRELHPRNVLRYDIAQNTLKVERRTFFGLGEPQRDVARIQASLKAAVAKRVPEKNFGILFSGGLDSSVLVKLCAQLGRKPVCYVTGIGDASDLAQAVKAAKELGVELRRVIIEKSELPALAKETVAIIGEHQAVKVAVGIPFLVACKAAAKDGIKVMLSGLGAEELFAGYHRHTRALDVNRECLHGLMQIYERDLSRDDAISMSQGIELRLPYLDKDLVQSSLSLDPTLKIHASRNKIALRQIAADIGLSADISEQPKKAAQYGSGVDRELKKLAKREGFSSRSTYLAQFQSLMPRLGVLWSGGKDSAYAAYTMHRQNYPLPCLVTLRSRNKDSYMFHTPAIDLVALQSQAMGIPLLEQETEGEKEAELSDLRDALARAIRLYQIDGIVTGALYSRYQRDRIEEICEQLGLKIFSPLWHVDQEQELRNLIDAGFKVVLVKVAAEGLDSSWLGKVLGAKEVDALSLLSRRFGLNIAGEGGETESLVLDCPLFHRQITLEETTIEKEGAALTLSILKATLSPKGSSG